MFNSNLFDVIRKPVVTEKALICASLNKYCFFVDVAADKNSVKNAIESIFTVNVAKVNILNVKGKTKKFKGRFGKRADLKKAIVTLANGQSIDVSGGKI
jgi:large subunit ribosomal protein L23